MTGKEVRDMENPEAIGLETEATTEATTDPAGGLESQVDNSGGFNGEQ